MMKPLKTRRGFTLIELLVVIAIIAILAAILFPVFAKARARAQQTACLSNEKQISLAFRQYNDDNDNRFMPAAGWMGPNGQFPSGSFVDVLAPYVKSRAVFLCPSGPNKFGNNTWSQQSDANASDTGWTWNGTDKSHYGMNITLAGGDVYTGAWTAPPNESRVKEPTRMVYLMDSRWVDLTGGTGAAGRIGRARFRHQGAYKPGDRTGGGLNVVFADGHVTFVRQETIIQFPASSDGQIMWVPK